MKIFEMLGKLSNLYDMKRKQVLITGGTSGIGYATAKRLAEKDFDVYIIGREEQACRLVVEELRAANPEGMFGYFVCDLLSPGQIMKTAEIILGQLDVLDVLVNNAGGVFASRELNEAGWEKTIALNHMAYFLLTRELLPLLKKADKARIVCVSSHSHLSATLDKENIQGDKKYFIMAQYGVSKLLNVLFVKEMARRLDGTGITINALHPGVVKTRIGEKSNSFFFGTAWKVFSLISGISVEEGAATSVFLAESPLVQGISGKYFSRCKETKVNPTAEDEETARWLWTYSENLLTRAGF
jgi:NAD(P)-dependent dehydrogenase (short-subunit alcohol dehydrogenase family)